MLKVEMEKKILKALTEKHIETINSSKLSNVEGGDGIAFAFGCIGSVDGQLTHSSGPIRRP